jgi:hypothetical protein
VLDHGPDLRRWDKKTIGRTHRLLVRSPDRATSPIGHSNQIIAVGSAPYRLGIRGLMKVLPTIPTNRHGVLSFAAAGARGVVVELQSREHRQLEGAIA